MQVRTAWMVALVGVAMSAHGAAPDCATNFRASDGVTQTSVEVAEHTPEQIIIRLGGRLQAAGVMMKSTEPKRGLLDAVGLTVVAEPSGTRTKVTFRSSVAADQATLCRYAALLADPPLTNSDVVRFHDLHVSDDDAARRIASATEIGFDLTENGLRSLKTRGVSPKVIAAMMQRAGAAVTSEKNADSRTPAQIRADLLARKEIGVLNNRAMFRTEADFLEFAIVSTRPLAANMREYKVSMLLPRDAATVATEDMSDAATGFAGERAGQRTRPIRVEATLLYTWEAGTLHLTAADITRIFTIP